MPQELPPNPHIEQLKKQAKDLRQAHRQDTADALGRIRAHLPRLGNASDAEVQAAAVSLQECQHVVAVEYGFKDWPLLARAVDATLEDLAQLSDHDAQVLMRHMDQKDLVTVLKGAATPIQEKFLKNMSARVRGFIESEIALLDIQDDAVAQVRQRILRQTLLLARDGHITWDGTTIPEKEALYALHISPEFFARAAQPLDQLTGVEMASMWREIAEQARREGILSLQQIEERMQDPLLREALQLAVDGTEPALIEDLIKIRVRTQQRRQETRAEMMVEGLLGIMAGLNPGIIAHKLSAYYTDGIECADRSNAVTTAQLARQLQQTPVTALDFSGLNALLTDMALVARQQSIAALEPLCRALEGMRDMDAEVLRRGLELMLASEEADHFRTALNTLTRARLEGLAASHRMILTGIIMVQAGKKPELIEAEVCRAGTS